MKTTTLLVALTLTGVALVGLPLGELSPTSTASASMCNIDDAVEGAECLVDQYVSCLRSTIKGQYCPRGD